MAFAVYDIVGSKRWPLTKKEDGCRQNMIIAGGGNLAMLPIYRY